MATIDVTSGETLSGLSLSGTDVLQVFSGGATVETTVLAFAIEEIYSNGNAYATMVSGGGSQLVTSGGTAHEAVVGSGGNQTVDAGGIAFDTMVASGGSAVVSSGGLEIASSGASIGVTLLGGTEEISTGAEAIGTLVDAGPFGEVSRLYVRSGGTAEGTVISGGLMIVDAGGLASNTNFIGGININDDGEVDGVVATDASQVFLENNARGSGITVSDLANDQIYSSAVTVGTTVNDLGYEVVSGGTASGTIVNSGGYQTVYGGSTVGTVLNNGGVETLSATSFVGPSSATGTIVNSGGSEYVSSGTTTNATVLNSGGFEYIYPGAAATNTTVNNGGTEIVSAGGEASGTRLMPGGTIDIPGFFYVSGASAILDPTTDILILSTPFQAYVQQLSGDYTGDTFSVAPASGSLTGTLLTVTAPPLEAVLPDPLHIDIQTVKGTGGVPGLQLERITQGTYNTPGGAGWVEATVNPDGSWSAPLKFDKPGMLAHVFAENGGTTTVVDLVDGTPVAPSTPPPAFAAVLPDPLYTGPETVTGTGGVKGLRLERITQGTYNTPGGAGWVNAAVAADGTWSVPLKFDKPGMLAHVYAQNGGSGPVIDLVNGVPSKPSAMAVSLQEAAKSVAAAVASDMTVHVGPAAAERISVPAKEIAIGALLHGSISQPDAIIATDHTTILPAGAGGIPS